MIASKGTKAASRLSIVCQFATEPKIYSVLEGSNFVPAPKVSTAFVLLPKRKELLADDITFEELSKVSTFAFNQRQKHLGGLFKNLLSDPEAVFTAAEVKLDSKAVSLGVEEYIKLTREIKKQYPYFFLRRNPLLDTKNK